MLKYCRNIWFNQKEPTDQHLQCCVNVSLTAYHNWPGGGSLAKELHEAALHHEPEASRHVEDDGEEDEVKWHPLVVGVIHDCVVTVVLKHKSLISSFLVTRAVNVNSADFSQLLVTGVGSFKVKLNLMRTLQAIFSIIHHLFNFERSLNPLNVNICRIDKCVNFLLIMLPTPKVPYTLIFKSQIQDQTSCLVFKSVHSLIFKF